MNKLITTGVFLLLIPITAIAYLDPGTGSMLFSSILGIMATLFFIGKTLLFKIHHLPSILSGRVISHKNRYGIVFYSEGGQYWHVFLPILRELSTRGINYNYFTSHKNDPGLNTTLPGMESRFIGEKEKLWFFLNTIEADMLIMTTPNLDVFQIKRSKKVKHYCHISHSAGGCGGYRVYGLDYFDSVLTGGHGDIEEIRELEKKRNTAAKQLVAIGCTYLDIMREKQALQLSEQFFNEARPTILLSPTWGKNGLLSQYGESILTALTANQQYNIIVRPHPQSYIVEQKLLNLLQAKFNSSQVIWDRAHDNFNALMQADLMISDFSGIIYDFLFLFEKPILTITSQFDKRATDAMDLDSDYWAIHVLQELGTNLDGSMIESLAKIVEERLNHQANFRTMIAKLHVGMDCYPGESGKRGADFIEHTLSKLNTE